MLMCSYEDIELCRGAVCKHLLPKAVDLDLFIKAIGNPVALDSETHRLLTLNDANNFCF